MNFYGTVFIADDKWIEMGDIHIGNGIGASGKYDMNGNRCRGHIGG